MPPMLSPYEKVYTMPPMCSMCVLSILSEKLESDLKEEEEGSGRKEIEEELADLDSLLLDLDAKVNTTISSLSTHMYKNTYIHVASYQNPVRKKRKVSNYVVFVSQICEVSFQ